MTVARMLTVALAACCLSPAVAAAQIVGDFKANLPVPTSPALSVLDVAADKASRPISTGDLVTSLVNVVDRQGVLQNGLAVDLSPFYVFAGKKLKRADYTTEAFTRFSTRARISVATTKASSAGKSAMRLAFGFTFTLFDKGDPFTDETLATCLAAAARAHLASKPPQPPPPADLTDKKQLADFEAAIAKVEAEREKGFKTTCRKEASTRLWNRSSIVVGVAPTWLSPEGTAGNLRSSGVASWGAAAYGFEGTRWLAAHGQLVGYSEYRTKGTIPNSDIVGANEAFSRVTAGARFRVGTEKSALSVGVEHQRFTLAASTLITNSATLATQMRLSDDVWLTLSVGGATKATGTGSQVFILNALSWKYGDK